MLQIFLRSPVAQSVEQVAVNHWVSGSSPFRGAIPGNDFSDFTIYAKITGYTFERKFIELLSDRLSSNFLFFGQNAFKSILLTFICFIKHMKIVCLHDLEISVCFKKL